LKTTAPPPSEVPAMHSSTVGESIIGRVIGKGLAADEMGDRLYPVVDGVDGRAHYVETTDHSKLDEIGRSHIVALEPTQLTDRSRAADLNIGDMTDEAGIYRPSAHLEGARAKVERIGGDPEAYVRSHVRRLEALRRAGHVERIDADRWKIPADIAERGMAHYARNRGSDFSVRILSRPSIWNGRSVAMARPGSTGNWPRPIGPYLPIPDTAGRSAKRWSAASRAS
jgi:hypothetical protein